MTQIIFMVLCKLTPMKCFTSRELAESFVKHQLETIHTGEKWMYSIHEIVLEN